MATWKRLPTEMKCATLNEVAALLTNCHARGGLPGDTQPETEDIKKFKQYIVRSSVECIFSIPGFGFSFPIEHVANACHHGGRKRMGKTLTDEATLNFLDINMSRSIYPHPEDEDATTRISEHECACGWLDWGWKHREGTRNDGRWNGGSGFACIFRYRCVKGTKPPTATLAVSWEYQLSESVIDAWKKVAATHSVVPLDLAVEVIPLTPDKFKTPGSVIGPLELRRLVIRPVSLCQLQWEANNGAMIGTNGTAGAYLATRCSVW
ncbi:hypothetical protein B0T16DRAFT_513643 [Cercophora newfieldiana]|uniref:DUF6546 domain-containing protein n=1 Tax=Cercophora newfieldiana TaxID=92897 RepID=A0AA40CMV3_9PEZI|nr:hypothetical protein B0T16DRAFT_513643 [Cercophora newfieldiana]